MILTAAISFHYCRLQIFSIKITPVVLFLSRLLSFSLFSNWVRVVFFLFPSSHSRHFNNKTEEGGVAPPSTVYADAAAGRRLSSLSLKSFSLDFPFPLSLCLFPLALYDFLNFYFFTIFT